VELAEKPTTATEKVARADAWWALAEKVTGKSKLALQRRAAKWYEDALPDLSSGLAKTKVELRLAQVSKEQDSKEDMPEKGSPAAASAARPLPAKAPFDEKTAKTLQTRWAKHLRVAVVETNSIGMKLTLIPPGEFEMGSFREVIEEEMKLTTTDHWYTDCLNGEGPLHRVRITKPFWMGTVPVTQEQYQRVMGENPINAQGDLQRPMEQVSCDAAMEFCRRLSEMPSETAAHRQYRLPSEAQWEYACRAGTTGLWFFSDLAKPKTREAQEKLGAEYGWIGSRETRGVGQKRANPFGLYDMFGNVFEWCQDIYDPDYYANSPTDDPTGPATSKATMTFHPLRGGSSYCSPKFGRSAYRFNHPGHLTRKDVGFRVVVIVAEKTGK
jgi:formylglycine-generating enzyme required for sulfatase activity